MTRSPGPLLLSLLLILGCLTPSTAVVPATATLKPISEPVRAVLPTERPSETSAPSATARPSLAPPATAKPSAAPPRTATTRPVVPRAPSATARPSPRAQPSPTFANVRVGAICKDGTTSTATGSGACSGHGGVSQWLYR